jgi:hypothetical protein
MTRAFSRRVRKERIARCRSSEDRKNARLRKALGILPKKEQAMLDEAALKERTALEQMKEAHPLPEMGHADPLPTAMG